MNFKILTSIATIFILSGCGADEYEGKKHVNAITTNSNSSYSNNLESDTEPNTNTNTDTETETETESNPESTLVTINFNEDSSINTSNPDRGFYDADYELNKDKNYNWFNNVIKNGSTLAFAPINLKDYKSTTTLPSILLDTIDKNLNYARSASVKIIFRIKYRNDINSDDPSKSIIMGHLEQLKPILQKHKDVISIVQAGCIGAWGEWHSFTGDYEDTNSDYKKNRKDIIEKLINIFPNKYIQLRTPMHKELLYGSSINYADVSTDAMITADIAFSNNIKAKIGHHNDCFLASETDMGTYASNNIEIWKDYVANDAQYSPVGGETCKDDQTFTNCPNAIDELKRFQYSYINQTYYPDVIQRWKDEGCYNDINENIGYRLVAKSLDIEQSTESIKFSLNIENMGYASPYIKSEVNYILKSDTQEYIYNQTIDLRKYYPNNTNIIKESISLSNIANGTYCLYLQIGKDYSAIKLSNSQLWESASKTNKLTCNIVVK